MHHLRYAGLTFERQRDVLIEIVRGQPLIMDALKGSRTLDLPQWRIVSGVIYNTVWNVLTQRPAGHGVSDIDLLYFNAQDLSWDAENAVIQQSRHVFDNSPLPVEIRNQARVHLWFPEKFGQAVDPLTSTDESLRRFAAKTHAVGLRLEPDDRLDMCAPFGLDSIFSFHILPNRALDNEAGYRKKAKRAQEMWPELTVEPW
ncbi:MAG: nucleotidyltransferase family protein [Alphaproteobacteria bacterium]|nr:nucleotidyltransferase family protein [Alphaproteobacteria bacterium]